MDRPLTGAWVAGHEVPAALPAHESVGLADDFQTIRVFAERDNSNIVHWSTFEKGGHYASLEAPEVLAGDIRAFYAGLRQA